MTALQARTSDFVQLLRWQSQVPAAVLALLLVSSSVAYGQGNPQRLSDWLIQHPPATDDYPLGLSWRVLGEIPAQHALLLDLMRRLSGQDKDVKADGEAVRRMREWLSSLPVTGRVRIAEADARWLQANPARDPVVGAGDTIVLPKRPKVLTVLTGEGSVCQVTHVAGHEAIDYLEACGQNGVDWAWIAQPDGRIQRFGVATWNRERQDEPAPGAWIWAPQRNAGWPQSFSEKLIAFLATQGPAPDDLQRPARLAHEPESKPQGAPGGLSAPFRFEGNSSAPLASGLPSIASPVGLRPPTGKSRDLELTQTDWGEAGLLQDPTARMAPAGHFSFSLSRVSPYTRGNVFVQPLDWLEAGFRYTNVSNRAYGPADLSGSQAYKDKSFDAKVRLWKESAYVPETAVGIRDLAGTGLFSGEYIVGSKRTGAFDWSLGLGWGYVGGRGDLRNPLSVFSKSFDNRKTTNTAQGGNFGFGTYFRGPTALFGGVQYQTPWEPLILKLEYDGNDYQHEPQDNNQPRRSPFNVGGVYRYSRSVDLTAGVERGNTVMLGLVLHAQLDTLSMPKINDPPLIPVSSSRPQGEPNWAMTSADIEARAGWHVNRIEQRGRELRVTLADAGGVYWRDRLDRAVAVLHRDAPAGVDRFVLVYRQNGIQDTEHVIDRDAWSTPYNQPLPSREQREAVIAQEARDLNPGAPLYQNPRPRFEHGLSPGFQQTLGGPDGFILYQISARESARYRIRDDTWVQGTWQLGLIDNYNKFKYDAPSELPRVRTFLREYLTTSRFTMPNLQLTHVGKLSQNQFYSLYGGYLESMFGGVGAEWLYRPFASRLAYGVDVNEVRQRDFRQDFAFRDYRVATGHATAYWDTGWNNVLATVSFGRYLAGDTGATVQLAKLFQNGVTVGAFATRTNVSTAQFGEGSFDKGVFLAIPFDAMLTRSSPSVGYFIWKPLTRDGGAKLDRAVNLYDVTSARNDRTLWYRPAPPANEAVMPSDRREKWTPAIEGPQPFTRVAPKSTLAQSTPDVQFRIEEALYGQGFRNISVRYDDSRRLDLNVSNPDLAPISRAVGRAARTALGLAPLDTREIRVVFSKDGHALATYQFTDAAALAQFFRGDVSLAQLASTVSVTYQDPSAVERDPLALLGDVSTEAVPGGSSTHMVSRVLEDYRGARRTAAGIDWAGAVPIGVGITLAASLLDKRAYRYAFSHQDSKSLKRTTTIGNAIPIIAMGAAGLAALGAPGDSTLSKTGYAAGEAGVTAFFASTALKYVVGRERPGEGVSNRSFKPFSSTPGHDSFPSRHTMIAWAAITPFAKAYDAPWLYGAAAITQVGRVVGRDHWFSDTVASALIGSAIGEVFYRSSREPRRGEPRVLIGPQSVSLAWEFN